MSLWLIAWLSGKIEVQIHEFRAEEMGFFNCLFFLCFNQLTPNTLDSLNQLVQLVQIGDYANGLGLHTQMVSGPDFSQIASFMPGIKVLLQTAMQLQVCLRWATTVNAFMRHSNYIHSERNIALNAWSLVYVYIFVSFHLYCIFSWFHIRCFLHIFFSYFIDLFKNIRENKNKEYNNDYF